MTAKKYKLDKHNANKGTDRGRKLVESSLRDLGAGRSIVADKHGEIIAGNKTYEAAEKLGLSVREIETDGTELVVVRRTDLDLSEPIGKARRLAYADNRAGEVGLDWNTAVLKEDLDAGLDVAALDIEDIELPSLVADIHGNTPATTARLMIPPRVWLTQREDVMTDIEMACCAFGVVVEWPK